MVGLAADHDPEAGDAGEAAGVGAELRRERELERPGDLEGLDRAGSRAHLEEALEGAVGQPLGEVAVEGGDADRPLGGGDPLALLRLELPDLAVTHRRLPP